MSTQFDEPTTRGYAQHDHPQGGWTPAQRRRQKKPFFLTSEFLTMLAGVVAIAIAAAVADNFEAPRAWTLITIVVAAYIISRGLSKIARGDGEIDRD